MYLGLHLGHDASASLFNERGLVQSVIQERHSRIRHDYGINIKTIDLLLESCQVKVTDIQAVGISSTQQMPAIIQSPNEIKIFYTPTPLSSKITRHHENTWLKEEIGLVVDRGSAHNLPSRFTDFIENNLVKSRKLPKEIFVASDFISFADPLLTKSDFTSSGKNLNQVVSNFFDNLSNDKMVSVTNLSEDLTISIHGIHLPASYWSHHACHASSNATLYGDERIIFTHDGGQGFQSGGFWKLGSGQLKLITLHELELGQLYDYFAFRLGLGSIGGAGKLMGLAAYGKGILFPELPFYGTPHDLIEQFRVFDGSEVPIESHYNHLWNLCIIACKNLQLDISRLGEPEFVTDIASTEIAHFIQRLLEKTMIILFTKLNSVHNFESVGFSGGVALNCPSNSNIVNKGKVRELFIEPHCEDGGCSIGAAQLTYLKHNEKFPAHRVIHPSSKYAFKGLTHSVINKISAETSERLAQLILEDKVIGIFFSDSEIGPRALGHRSIIANPKYKENWRRVNNIKGRELWRPFAPAILKTHLREYFYGGPEDSPFMLFNYHVKGEFIEKLPAITHSDGTARVQTITEIDDPLYEILSALLAKNELPIVMNTSFNGPGQPIIETETEALVFFENSGLDALLLNHELLEK